MKTQSKTKQPQFPQLRKPAKKSLPADSMGSKQAAPRLHGGHSTKEDHPVSEMISNSCEGYAQHRANAGGNKIITESYEGHLIPFQAGDAFVNATEMCKAFGKRPVDFLRLPETKRYQDALAKDLNVLCENLTTQVQGNFSDGRHQGTWFHPDLAMECARWISPDFSIWCNRTIRRILSGEMVIQPAFKVPKTLSGALRLAAEKADKAELMEQTALTVTKAYAAQSEEVGELKTQVTELKPLAEKYRTWMNSREKIPMNVACRLIDQEMGRQQLFDWLRAEDIFYNAAGGMPYSSYISCGYFRVGNYEEPLEHGQIRTTQQVFVTPLGVAFCADLRKQYHLSISKAAMKDAPATLLLTEA